MDNGAEIRAMLNDALDSLARLDVDKALEVAKFDVEMDSEFQSALRRLATYLLEDPRNIRWVIDALFAIKAVERVGDHAAAIALLDVIVGGAPQRTPVCYVDVSLGMRHPRNPLQCL